MDQSLFLYTIDDLEQAAAMSCGAVKVCRHAPDLWSLELRGTTSNNRVYYRAISSGFLRRVQVRLPREPEIITISDDDDEVGSVSSEQFTIISTNSCPSNSAAEDAETSNIELPLKSCALECKICFDPKLEIAFYKCGHLCCRSCAYNSKIKKKCPFCCKRFKKRIKIYIP